MPISCCCCGCEVVVCCHSWGVSCSTSRGNGFCCCRFAISSISGCCCHMSSGCHCPSQLQAVMASSSSATVTTLAVVVLLVLLLLRHGWQLLLLQLWQLCWQVLLLQSQHWCQHRCQQQDHKQSTQNEKLHHSLQQQPKGKMERHMIFFKSFCFKIV